MQATISTKSGTVKVLAGEQGVPPGVVRLSVGPFFTLNLTAQEAAEIARVAAEAASAANYAAKYDAKGQA